MTKVWVGIPFRSKTSRASSGLFASFILAGLVLGERPLSAQKIADSADDWSATGAQAEKNWFNGHRR